MAWMKIDLELPDKTEVHGIAGITGLDPDAVVGKLIRVWQWFDKHTVDGNAYGVTYSLVDRLTHVTGFGEAMMFVGWLEQNDNVLHMPKFEKHTSASAKARALTSVRQSVFKENQKLADIPAGNSQVTLAPSANTLPREEKEKKKHTYVRFDAFWNAWPKTERKNNKAKCREKWGKLGLDDLADEIISHVEALKETRKWLGGYEPAPLTYLNGRQWEDGLPDGRSLTEELGMNVS